MKKVILLLTLIASLSLCSCGGESQYEKDLNSGVKKLGTGEKMTEGEKNATSDFLEWQQKQQSK